MWNIRSTKPKHRVAVRDETLRDGNQGEVARSTFAAIKHILDTHQWYDQMSIGWIYTNPVDTELANYLRTYLSALEKKCPDLKRDKFFVYSLVYTGSETDPAQVKDKLFGPMLRDMQTGNQPYGAVNLLTKARVSDLADLPGSPTSAEFQKQVQRTLKLLHDANPEVELEMALEHVYTAWTEEARSGKDSREHILNTMVTGLLNGVSRITLPDTDGAHEPDEIKQVIRDITTELQHNDKLLASGIRFKPSMLVAHMHDDRNCAGLNTKAALEVGVGSFDSTAGMMGERMGNATLANMAELLWHPQLREMKLYQEEFERSLGMQRGDKQVGDASAFGAVGGMHAARLWEAYCQQREEGINYDEFRHGYRGSYGSVPADRFGHGLQVTLSPVAGISNVQFMLARLGMHIDDKKDPRLKEVLDLVKRGEHEQGINYRGVNNANAMLLLADRFGLREQDHFAGDPPFINGLQFTLNPKPDAYARPLMSLRLSGGSSQLLGVPPLCVREGVELQKENGSPDGQAYKDASHLLDTAMKYLRDVDSGFEKIQIIKARRYQTNTGALTVKNGDPFHPVQHKRECVKLMFSDGKENWQANGVGDDYGAALSMAMNTMLDFACMRIEQERVRVGQSGMLHAERLRARLENEERSRRENDAGVCVW